MHYAFTIISGLLFIAAFVPYILAIHRGKTKPAKASWLIWATLDTITLAGMIAEDAVGGQIVGAVAGAWIVTAFAFKHGTSGWSVLDKFCLGGAVLGVALWKSFDDPVLGIVTSLAVVFIAAFPTFASAWRDPSKEDRLAWLMFWLSCVAALLGVQNWTFAEAAQPVTFTIIETVMMYLVWIRPRRNAATAP